MYLLFGDSQFLERVMDLYSAKEKAVVELKVPASKRHLVAIEAGYEGDEHVGYVAFYKNSKVEIYNDGRVAHKR